MNICFPYTSRAEIATAIRSTVQEFLTPPPPKNTPFSPSRIRKKVLSRQLGGRDPLPTIPDDSLAEVAGTDEERAEKESAEADADGGDSSSATLPPDSPEPRLWANHGSYEGPSLPNPESITVENLERHMYTASDPPLELFIRTSGVERLSDFMLWQCHQETHIFFLQCYWPDFDLRHFIRVMLEWQWRQKQKEREENMEGMRKGNPWRLLD